MKKALIDIKRINNSDVIATSAAGISCDGLDPTKYNTLFQFDGTVYGNSGGYWLEGKNGNMWIYYGGVWNKHSSLQQDYYSYSSPSLTNGKWYHLYSGLLDDNEYDIVESGIIVECTNPDHIPN